MGAVRGLFALMQKKILSLLMGDDLIRMPFIRRVGMLGVLFGLDIGIWSGSLIFSLTYETGCSVKMFFVKDSGTMGN